MTKRSRYSPQLRDRAGRMVFDHEHDYPSRWAAIQSIAAKIGCTSETLRLWVLKAEGGVARKADGSSYERERFKDETQAP
jgi:transposase